MDLSHILNQLAEDREAYRMAVAPPLFQTSNFAFTDVPSLRDALADEYGHTLYSRGNNPTVDLLRAKLAALDGAEDCLVLSSGVAAAFLAVFAHLKAGDHVVCVRNPYSWTDRMFRNLLPRFGVTTAFVDGTRTEAIEGAVTDSTRLIFLESPNTLTFELQDLAAVAALAKPRGIVTVVDNSYCSPLNQQPLKMGIDLSVQTATKFIGGHSDTLAGVVCGRKKLIEKMFVSDFLNIGAVVSPFNAWLLIRSLRTLELRVRRSGESAMHIVEKLEGHARIRKIHYPFLASFPQAALAKRQMTGPGALFTLDLDVKSAEAVEAFCTSLNRFLLAVSWGGHESLVFPAIAAKPKEAFDASEEKDRLVRFYVGLEEPDLLLKDIEQALDRM